MRAFFILVLFLLLPVLVLFGNEAVYYALSGYELFISRVFPSLFPFLVIVGCLKRLGAFDTVGRKTKAQGPLGLRRLICSCLPLFAAASLCGAPSGSVAVDSAIEQDERFTPGERSVLSAFLNLCSPMFLLTAVAGGFLGQSAYPVGTILIAAHLLASLMLTILFCFYKYFKEKREFCRTVGRQYDTVVRQDFGAICKHRGDRAQSILSVFPAAVFDAVTAMLKMLGTLVFFFVFASLADKALRSFSVPPVIRGVITGLFEMTCGIEQISALPLVLPQKLILISFLCSFGGLSVMMQVHAVRPVVFGKYVAAKLAHALLAALICALACSVLLNKSASVFDRHDAALAVGRFISLGEIALLSVFAAAVSSVMAVFFVRRTRT